MNIFSIPSAEDMQHYQKAARPYMRPNTMPYALVLEGALAPEECDRILVASRDFKTYRHPGCEARTRELGHIPELEGMRRLVELANTATFEYELDAVPVSWLQTYWGGDSYPLHLDSQPGTMRKLTAVAILSHPENYVGGELELHWPPAVDVVSKTQGTIVVFHPMITHRVTPLEHGVRHSVNMGFYGPNFR